MSDDFDFQNRQVIPRWHPYHFACLLGETQSDRRSASPKVFSEDAYSEKKNDWLKFRTVVHATDLVGSALVINDFDNPIVIEAAEFILKNKDKASEFSVEIAAKTLRQQVDQDKQPLTEIRRYPIYHHIAVLKKYVRMYPVNSIVWADLAFYYSILGQKEKAKKCMDIASYLGSENRFILRSAARCYLHIGEADRALDVLRRSSFAKTDPWLLASEISISEACEIKSRRVKEARKLLKDRNKFSRDLAELIGTFGTLEFNSGSVKKAKKLLRAALEDPNENTVAQVEWISPRIGVDFERGKESIPALFEADARVSWRKRKYNECLNLAWKWLRYQPNSSRPAIFGSYAASVGMYNDHEAIKIIEMGKIPSPDDFLLKNNYAFSLASIDEVDRALEVMTNIDFDKLTTNYKAIYTATSGLISFRMGITSEGRDRYRKAISMFERNKQKAQMALAYLFWGREESRIKSKESFFILEKAENLGKGFGLDEVVQYAEFIRRKRDEQFDLF